MFIICILIWALVGFHGILNCKTERINYEMLIFLGTAPFIPLIAKIFGIF